MPQVTNRRVYPGINCASLILNGREWRKYFSQITFWVVYSRRITVKMYSGLTPMRRTCLLSYANLRV